MTVKIKDRSLLNEYASAMQAWLENEDDTPALACRFLNYIDDSHSVDDVRAVVDAIFDGEKVELDEQKYVVPLPHLAFGGNQIYLVKTSASKEIMIDWKPFPSDIQSKLTMDEIPEEYRKLAKKVED